MGLNADVALIRGESRAVEDALREYVELGPGYDDATEPQPPLPSTQMQTASPLRKIVLLPPANGWILALGESDRTDERMVQFVSQRLGCEAIVVSVSEIASAWGFRRYRAGRVQEQRFDPESAFVHGDSDAVSDADVVQEFYNLLRSVGWHTPVPSFEEAVRSGVNMAVRLRSGH